MDRDEICQYEQRIHEDIQSTASNKLVRAFCLGAVRSLAFAAAKVAISSTAAFILSNVSLPRI